MTPANGRRAQLRIADWRVSNTAGTSSWRALPAIAFILVWMTGPIWQPGHELATDTISSLALGENGWLMTAAFILFGGWLIFAGTGYGRLIGVGFVGLGLVPDGPWHGAIATATFIGMVIETGRRSTVAGGVAVALASLSLAGLPLIGLTERALWILWLASPYVWKSDVEPGR